MAVAPVPLAVATIMPRHGTSLALTVRMRRPQRRQKEVRVMKGFRMATVVGLLCGLALAPTQVPVVGARPVQAAEQRIDVNTATAEELEVLPGIGPAKAQAIVEHRAKHPFTAPEDLRDVRGIGDALYERLKEHVTVGSAGTP
jgi:comEA protein